MLERGCTGSLILLNAGKTKLMIRRGKGVAAHQMHVFVYSFFTPRQRLKDVPLKDTLRHVYIKESGLNLSYCTLGDAVLITRHTSHIPALKMHIFSNSRTMSVYIKIQ